MGCPRGKWKCVQLRSRQLGCGALRPQASQTGNRCVVRGATVVAQNESVAQLLYLVADRATSMYEVAFSPLELARVKTGIIFIAKYGLNSVLVDNTWVQGG